MFGCRAVWSTLLLYRLSDIWREVAFAIDFATADPNLNPNQTCFGQRFSKCIIDIALSVCKGVLPSLYISERAISAPFRRTGDLNFLSLQHPFSCRSNRHFSGTTVGDFSFHLAGDITGYNLSIQFRAFDFKYIDLNLLFGDLLSSSFSLSTSWPPLPIIIPGLEV